MNICACWSAEPQMSEMGQDSPCPTCQIDGGSGRSGTYLFPAMTAISQLRTLFTGAFLRSVFYDRSASEQSNRTNYARNRERGL